MRSSRVFHAVDSHTEGMPTRVITGGVGTLPGDTMFERRQSFIDHLDGVRPLLMNEPRVHAAMSGAILQPSTRPDADVGVLFIEVSGCLPMCGHGAIGVATVLVETGIVAAVEPVTTIRLDTPAGVVVAEVAVDDSAATAVTIRNVPSFSYQLDASAPVPGYGTVRYDMAVHPGWLDRSPCGTGTSGRMAQLHARGALSLDTDFITSRSSARTSLGGWWRRQPSPTCRRWFRR